MSLFSSNHTKFPTPSHMHLIILCQAVSFVNPTEYNFQKQIVHSSSQFFNYISALTYYLHCFPFTASSILHQKLRTELEL